MRPQVSYIIMSSKGVVWGNHLVPLRPCCTNSVLETLGNLTRSLPWVNEYDLPNLLSSRGYSLKQKRIRWYVKFSTRSTTHDVSGMRQIANNKKRNNQISMIACEVLRNLKQRILCGWMKHMTREIWIRFEKCLKQSMQRVTSRFHETTSPKPAHCRAYLVKFESTSKHLWTINWWQNSTVIQWVFCTCKLVFPKLPPKHWNYLKWLDS